MAVQKPLVIINGQIQQIPSGDTMSAASSEVDVISLTATATVVKGCPVYIDAAGSFNKANAAAVGTAKVIGFAAAGISAAASGIIQTDGILACTTGEWDAVAGTTGGLAAGTEYYLASSAGLISSTAPSGAGNYVVKVGTAISTTELEISIGDSVKLA
jgi:hypothetical protein